jgi:hypothetical protein
VLRTAVEYRLHVDGVRASPYLEVAPLRDSVR